MKGMDIAKAFGLAILILILDLAVAYAFVSSWAAWIEPGHSRDFVVAAAPRLSTISTRIAGPLLFALLVWLFSRNKPNRNPFLFATTVFVLYVLLDGASVAFQGFFSGVVFISLTLKLIGAMLGAALSRTTERGKVEG